MDPPDADPLFDEVSLESLRRRRSEKWSKFPPDVLPSFVAELDFAPAPPIAAVLTRAIAEGDLGYALAGRSGLARAFAGFADRRWGWGSIRDPSWRSPMSWSVSPSSCASSRLRDRACLRDALLPRRSSP